MYIKILPEHLKEALFQFSIGTHNYLLITEKLPTCLGMTGFAPFVTD
jgi:hypothetical protein